MVFKWFLNGFFNGRLFETLIVASLTSRMRGHGCGTNSLKKLELHKEGSIKENIEITFKACFGLLKGFCHKGKWIKIWA